MKLQPDRYDVPAITGHGTDWIGLDGTPIAHSVVIGSRGERLDWPGIRFADLGPAHFETLAALEPEVVLLGSGGVLRFPHPSWLGALTTRRIGLEAMDTLAACRTYNILAGEGRHVVAVLLLENP